MSGELPWAISRITVDRLFNLYSYELPPKSQKADFSRVLILYGDNGSGKTTILQLLFHLLSPELRRGHKTFVARTMFQSIVVQFANGTTVSATRETPRLGSFQMSVVSQDGLTSCLFEIDEKGIVPATPVRPDQLAVFRRLSELEIWFYFLSDNRKIQLSSSWLDISEAVEDEAFAYEEFLTRRRLYEEERERPDSVDTLVTAAVDRTVEWLRQKVTQGSNVGAENANNIYIDIVQRIGKLPEKGTLEAGLSVQSITRSLKEAARRNESYAKFELTAPLDARALVTALSKAPTRNKPVILSVLKPFVEGMNARLDALSSIQFLLETLLRSLNTFFIDKSIHFTLNAGFQITSANGSVLKPSGLSSGEKHLLLMLCNSIMSTGTRSVFIIDEPELSLNVKWQRKLIPVLLELSKHAAVQYIFATHSIELLTNSLDNVVKLRTKLRNGRGNRRRAKAPR